MNKEDTFLLGRISKVHGKDGAVVIHIRPDLFDAVERQKALFIGINEYVVPFFMDWMQDFSHDEIKVKFEGVNDPEAANWFAGKEVYLPKSAAPKKTKAFSPSEIIGFTVTDENYGPLGIVEELLEYPMHEVLRIVHNGKDVLIPVAQEIILSFDSKAKTIHINAPDGLIDLYLNEEA